MSQTPELSPTFLNRQWKPYPSYRRSGVEWLGQVPEHWEIRKLKFASPSSSEKLTGKPEELTYVGLENVESKTGRLRLESLTEDVDSIVSVFRPRDVLFGKLRPYLAKVFYSDFLGVCTSELMVLRPISQLINSKYLSYLLLSDGFINLVDSTTYGAKMPRANPNDILNISICRPSLEEQKQIAKFLDRETTRIDTLITKKRELIELLQKKREAIIHQSVTKGLDPTVPLKDSGIPWIGKIPAHWVSNIKLLYLASEERNSFVNGPFGSDLLTSEITSEGVPVIYSGDIKHNRFLQKSNKYVTEEKAYQLNFCRVDPGDLVIAKVGNPPGDTAVYPINALSGIVTQDVVRIKLNPEIIFPEYLSLFLNSRSGRCIVGLISVESTRGRFSLGDFKGARIFIPHLKEQKIIMHSITNTLASLKKQESIIYQTIYCLEKYRLSIITAAVTGKIDVREAVEL